MPGSIYLDSLLHRHVFRAPDQRHIAVHGYPINPDGTQPVVFAGRRHDGSPHYRDIEFGAMHRICGELAGELATIGPAGP